MKNIIIRWSVFFVCLFVVYFVANAKVHAIAQANLQSAMVVNLPQYTKQELLDEQQRLFENDVLVLADVIQKHLTEGAPCPVCGSREHPACKGESTSSADDSLAVGVAEKIRQLNTEMQKVNSEMDRYGLAKDRACNAENAATEEIDSAKQSLGYSCTAPHPTIVGYQDKPNSSFTWPKIGRT